MTIAIFKKSEITPNFITLFPRFSRQLIYQHSAISIQHSAFEPKYFAANILVLNFTYYYEPQIFIVGYSTISTNFTEKLKFKVSDLKKK
ncbi:MAG: hypothetical protein F6K48_33350 [Okeania sp. SIO3H1]|uniref:hypothetical protein n=1 Tax=Okeania sp. SIO1I7 TaxID=2607772 RepID=UPI0013C68336|nr:hypothetical protein [Okeania sp. SIO1I7]NEN93503.1 hypothetical protein [Okeania sp. SIO3H1]NET25006.1 hypothetical protein [Okeania sp. SIO1I7]